ncbi:sugar transferase [Halanaerobium kushneri]|uniref:Sugar transferase involved in LPS biosynthesis (Colanic, teichoic acid) n=1 Tax=Halanaerobium kushneri TaxID=56779 RepID=A0A1N6RQP8_9FIRM|nr:sugar transferase [Halanaerobium kushneri]SIQ31109.1 Sugar transferase involved in LPS biosynthesis (colanic, teichoic acid) [Halanaerobium kushneri]
MNNKKFYLKYIFDFIVALIGFIITSPIILISYLVAFIETGESGFFTQKRVGKDSQIFKIIKVKTMKSDTDLKTNVTTDKDPRITASGRFFRKTKIDELPQLINILKGEMSFVGPRPDVPEIINTMGEEEKGIILSVRPGITGPASLKYENEEEILAAKDNPERYNKEVIFPDKVRINKEYIENYSFFKDIYYILKTIF